MRRLSLLLALTGCSPVVVDFGDGPANPGLGFSVSPASLDFGTVFVGGSTALRLTIENTSDAPLALVLDLPDEAYTLDAAELTPDVDQTALLNVRFAPTRWGASAASLTLTNADGEAFEVPIGAAVQEDADGDEVGSGVTGGADCDDTDASAYPGAPDEWYDGVDSDCAGDNDYDQDLDSAELPDDCDDTDASVYPDAPDEWYDGLDSDCRGNDDYDQDADGSAYDIDCDDTNALAYPGGTDPWYDGLDGDCAGDDDYDQDADGFQYGADCDDADPATYPGAADAWYDGLDADCAGNDDSDQDADGTPFDADCDDLDPTITIPTTESWDGVDNDCDGTVDDLAVATVADGILYGDTAALALGGSHGLSLGGDLDSDGAADLLVVSSSAGTTGHGWLVSGLTAIGASGAIGDYDLAALTGVTATCPVSYVAGPMVDLTADGVADVLAAGSSGSSGCAWLLDATDATGAVSLPDSDVASFTGDTTADQLRWALGGDLDGNGVNDVVTAAIYDGSVSPTAFYTGNISVFSDSPLAGAYTIADADSGLDGAAGYDNLGSSLAIADVTGDGYADLIAGAQGSDVGGMNSGAVYVFGGGATPWATDRADTAAALTINGTTSDGLGTDAIQTPGNLDGDRTGAADLVLSSTYASSVYVFFDVGSLSGHVALTSADTTFTGATAGFGTSAAAASDLNADGNDDLVIGASGDDTNATNAGAVYVFYGHGFWGSTMTSADADASVFGALAGDALGAGVAAGGDADGDGHEDLLLGATGADAGASGGGAVYLLLGR